MTAPSDAGSPAIADISTVESLRRRVADLEARLREAQDTLDAIRGGEIDALVVGGPEGEPQVYTLRDADRPYRLLIERMREGAVTLTGDGTVLYCNRAFADLVGVPPERLIGGPFARFVAGGGAERKRFARLVRMGGKGEFTLQVADSRMIPVLISIGALPPEDGGEAVLSAVITDLSEEKRQAATIAEANARLVAEAARSEGEGFARLILESATDYAIIATDLDARVTTWNTGAERIFGWQADEIVGAPAPKIWTPEDRADGVPEREMSKAVTDGRGEDQRWHLRKDGSRFWANGLMMPLRGGDGRHIGFLKILRDQTQRRTTEAALAASEERFRLATEAFAGATWETDFATGHAARSDRFADLIGLSPQDLVPVPEWWQERMHPDDLARYRAERQRLFEGREDRFDIEYRVRHEDGRWVWLWQRAIAVRDGSGRVVKLVGAVVDISDRKCAEERLRETGARMEAVAAERAAILGQLAEGVIVTDADGRITFVNDAAAAIHGVKRLDVAPDDYSDTYHLFTEDGRPYPSHDLPLFRAVRGETVGDARWRIRRPDGREVLAIGSARPVRASDGRALGAVLTLRDDTAREGAERRLRDQAEELQTVLDTVPAAIWIARDAECHRIVGNRRALEILRMSGDANMSKSAADAPSHFQVLDAGGRPLRPDELPVQSAARGEPVIDFEERIAFDDGETVELFGNAVPLRDAGGNVRGAVAAFVDITDRKRAETALRRLNETLEARVAEEVAERAKTEEQLRQAQKMEAVGQLTGGIAHDFNNLLTGIVGSIELLQKRVGEGRHAEIGRYADMAMGSATRASALTQRLLAFARRQSLDPKPVDANALVADMEDLVRRTVGENIAVETILAPDLWRARCDANQLESALLNLCINARDAMPEGGRLLIETANADIDAAYAATVGTSLAPGAYVMIAVADTGTGMTAEVKARVFDPFFTTKPIGQGTGLGLSMLYGFVMQSGGHVRIHSEPGLGTRVTLHLPRDAAEAGTETAPEAPERARGSATVLVVEDEAMIRLLVVETLEELGYTVLEAGDGKAALPAIEDPSVPIDLLVTDVGLPKGMNGRQLADRAREVRPGLKVLFVTGYAGNAAVGNGQLEPGMEMITKPFALDVLAARIAELLAEPG